MRMGLLSGVFAILSAGSALAACGEPAATAATPAVADASGAEAFVRDLYAGYSDTPGNTGPETPWSARTEALWDENAEAAQGVGYLGFDPVCNCQDFYRLGVTALTVTSTGADSADAAVTFVIGEPVSTISQTLKLVREGGAWKIDDIVWGDGATMQGRPSMVEGLIASTAELAAMPEAD